MQHLRAAVLQDVGHLVGAQVPVDGGVVEPRALRGPGHLEELEVVLHHDGDDVAPRQAQRAKKRASWLERRPMSP